MFMRSACLAIVLFGCVAPARADWQPIEPPPVPPETENSQRGRAAPAAVPQSGSASPQPTPAVGSVAPASAQAAQPPAADTPTVPPPSATGATPVPAGALAQAGAARKRLDSEALQAFPPAPPPVAAGAAPEQPTSALTSFAPAPAPAASAPGVGTSSAGARSPAAPGANPTPTTSAAARAPTNAIASSAADTQPAAASDATPTAATSGAPAGAAAGGVAEPTAADGGAEVHPPAARATELWSASALFGVGATFDNTVAGVNPLGFGFGVRADYRIRPTWSLGARLLYFVGGSVELPTHDVVMQSWLLAAEGAYVLDLDPLTIQPGVALGLFVRETNYRGFAPFITEDPTSIAQPDTTRLFFYCAPGINVSLPLAVASPSLAPLTVGADVRLDVSFGRRVTSSIQLLGQVGLRF